GLLDLTKFMLESSFISNEFWKLSIKVVAEMPDGEDWQQMIGMIAAATYLGWKRAPTAHVRYLTKVITPCSLAVQRKAKQEASKPSNDDNRQSGLPYPMVPLALTATEPNWQTASRSLALRVDLN